MPSAEDITTAVNRYLETVSQGRPDDIVALYAEDASVEDPVGSDLHIGRGAIREVESDEPVVRRKQPQRAVRRRHPHHRRFTYIRDCPYPSHRCHFSDHPPTILRSSSDEDVP